jgi:DNA-binding LytR/AlgR family response regulator
MRLLFLLLLALLAGAGPAAAEGPKPWPVATGPVLRCDAGPAPDRCRPVDLQWLRLAAPETRLARVVTVEPKALPMSRPLMVWMIGMASSEIEWNGVVIGRNGVPAADPAGEVPGRFFATFTVPDRLVRPGRNIVAARVSAHHLWLPVRRPIHVFDVGPYETTYLPGLASYLPALLALGALAAAAIYFGVAWLLDRRDRGALLLGLIAATALLQLGVEIARTFIFYSYPWHIARVAAVALLAAITSILAAAYAARRFAPAWRRRVTWSVTAAAAAALLLIPYYDIKALAAILAAAIAMTVCGAQGLQRSIPGAWAAATGGAAMIALMAWQLTDFLDQAYYVALAAMLVALVAEQISALRQARRGLGDERSRSTLLEERLRQAQGRDRLVSLKDGTRVHRVAEADMLFVKAADDYCEARLADGRDLLVTSTLAALHASLPERFVRVHKSYVVNADHVVAAAPRPGGGRTLKMTDGSSVPVGRAYRAAAEGILASA